MKLSAFRFSLPTDRIALYPAETRDESRLMIVHKETGKIEHRLFKDIIEYFEAGDTLVVNDSKVFPAKIFGNKEKTGAQVDVLLLRALTDEMHLWDTIVDPARKVRVGNKLEFSNGRLVAEVVDNTTSRGRTLKFLFDGTREEFYDVVSQIGNILLPDQLKRKPSADDAVRYQTVYATQLGGIVVPTAGLHFTNYLLKKIELKGIHIVPITLHIGLGMFRTIDMEDLTKYKTYSEYFAICEETAQTVNASLDSKRQVCAVGTSCVRGMEASVSVSARLKPNKQWTNRSIFPALSFKICTSLLTGFHLPESISLTNAVAFGGHELIMEAYQVAIKEKYRFFVYGDAMLII